MNTKRANKKSLFKTLMIKSISKKSLKERGFKMNDLDFLALNLIRCHILKYFQHRQGSVSAEDQTLIDELTDMIPPNQRRAVCINTDEDDKDAEVVTINAIHWNAFALRQSHLTSSNEIVQITSRIEQRFPQIERWPPQLRLSSSTETSSLTDFENNSEGDSTSSKVSVTPEMGEYDTIAADVRPVEQNVANPKEEDSEDSEYQPTAQKLAKISDD